MNRRKFLGMAVAAPVAAVMPTMDGMSPSAVNDSARQLLLDTEILYVGINQRASYRWVTAENNYLIGVEDTAYATS